MPAVLNLTVVAPLILSACCICQRLRDAQGRWQEPAVVTAGFGQEIAFSHTICPECARTFYPEFYQPCQAMPDPGA